MNPATVPTFKTSPVTGRLRWTEALVYAADAAGFLGEGDRYELIDGELYEMPPPDPIHEWAIRRIVRLLKASMQATPNVSAAIARIPPPIHCPIAQYKLMESAKSSANLPS